MLRKAAAWIYNWITVLTGIVTGFLAFVMPMIGDLLNLLDVMGPIDPTQWPWTILSATTMAKVTGAVALLKGLHAMYLAQKAAA